jgi:phage/plasmid-associated DNA primase
VFSSRFWCRSGDEDIVNSSPVAYDESDAFFRRKVILGFPNRFEGSRDDPKLTTEEELSGVFDALMIVLMRIFIKEKTIEQRRDRYAIAANPVEMFLEDTVVKDSVTSDVVAHSLQECSLWKV